MCTSWCSLHAKDIAFLDHVVKKLDITVGSLFVKGDMGNHTFLTGFVQISQVLLKSIGI